MSCISLKALIETPFLIFMNVNPVIFDLRRGRVSSRWLFIAGSPSHLIIRERALGQAQRQNRHKVAYKKQIKEASLESTDFVWVMIK